MEIAEYLESLPAVEKRAFIYAGQLQGYIKKAEGRYLRGDDGTMHVSIGGQRIPLDYDRNNRGLAQMMINACGVSTLDRSAQAAIQRIQVSAEKNANCIRLRGFSALSEDGLRLYVPIDGGKVLKITADSVAQIPNGDNENSVWVEHPEGKPFSYSDADPTAGLAHFERLLVETQACKVPEMKWLVAMHEGLFPFIREECPARFIVVHIGPSQLAGKTSGAQRYTQFHGLGEVKGDFTVAALNNQGDIGLLVMDNKEQANFTRELIDYCLFLATGGQRGRSNSEGGMRRSSGRAVGVITSIEGAWKEELQNRCVEVEYLIKGDPIKRGPIEREITERRDEMTSAIVPVLQRYLLIKPEDRPSPNPIPQFEEHFTALCNLLWAYGEIAGKPQGWAEAIMGTWNEVLDQHKEAENELEQPLREVLTGGMFLTGTKQQRIIHNNRQGTLYITEAERLLALLRGLNRRDLELPKNSQGLSRRLRSNKFRSLTVLHPENAPEIPVLQRKPETRPLGIFIADDAVTQHDAAVPETVIQQVAD
jgi:hypothetical protein